MKYGLGPNSALSAWWSKPEHCPTADSLIVRTVEAAEIRRPLDRPLAIEDQSTGLLIPSGFDSYQSVRKR